MQEWEICLRLVLSCAMGGIIGYERQMRHKSAGLRTNMKRSPLMDIQSYMRALEDAYVEIWKKFCDIGAKQSI